VIAYTDSASGQIFRVRPNGSAVRQLTFDAGYTFNATWSADGNKIAFDSEGAIWVMRSDGARLHQVTYPPRRAHDSHPTWSPDGRQLAFEEFPGIWVVNIDGSGLRSLERPGWYDRAPDWSPDGSQIAFTSVRRSDQIRRTDVWTMAPDGNYRHRVTDDVGWDYDPNWSPDGSMIAYEHWKDIDASGDLARVYLVNADGSGKVGLNPTGARYPLDLGPAWAPNGKRIVFENSQPDQLATMRTDGSDLHPLGVAGRTPSWRSIG
jgi:Tol biopolymer transport system component